MIPWVRLNPEATPRPRFKLRTWGALRGSREDPERIMGVTRPGVKALPPASGEPHAPAAISC